jgi:hypothetical protein
MASAFSIVAGIRSKFNLLAEYDKRGKYLQE